MPNYSGKSPLRMTCPHCGKEAEHPVVETDPTTLSIRLLERDISYRRRTKRCALCNEEFDTVEMAHDIWELDSRVHELCSKLYKSLESNQALKEQVSRIEIELSRVKD